MTVRPDPKVERWLDEGAAAYEARDWVSARRAYRQAVTRAPDDIRGLYSLAMVDLQSGHRQEASRGFRRVLARDRNHYPAWRNLAALCEQGADWVVAREAYSRALDAKPEDIESRFGLARALAVLGEINAAETQYRALCREPSWTPLALARLAALDPGRLTDNDLRTIQAARPAAEGDLQIELAFAEAAALRARDQAPESFAAYIQANALKREALADAECSLRRFRESVELVIATHPKSRFADDRPRKARETDPIFIVGLPRSGSSLLERLIAQSFKATALGETALLGEVSDPWLGDPHADWAAIARHYLRACRERPGSGTASGAFIDKTLENALRIGAIALMFPGAPIIHCVRDRRETALSCWRQLFASGNETLYDLEDIAETIRLHERLMAHWRDALPGRIVEVQLEDLVRSPVSTLERLAAHLGAPRNSAAPPKHRLATATASAALVTQPIAGPTRADHEFWRNEISAAGIDLLR